MAEAVKVAVKEKQIKIEGLEVELASTIREYEGRCDLYEKELVKQNIASRNKIMQFTLVSLVAGYLVGNTLK